ncbi:MAG: Ig-like domain repeat protein [Planctomycetes bacterium]|nr:Ig-like domain repeat protein [Planctomycetota bacterium]
MKWPFRRRSVRPIVTRRRTRLEFEQLEDRTLPSGNLLMTVHNGSTDLLQERTPAGDIVSSIPIPQPQGSTENYAHGVVVDVKGNIDVYWGGVSVYVATYSPTTQSWSSQTFPGLSTATSLSGAVAAFGNYVFATDMNTNSGPEVGIVRFDVTGGPTVRFAQSNEYVDATVGLDGLLYCLVGSTHISVFNPITMAPVREFDLTAPGSFGTLCIAVDAGGNILAGTASTTVLKIDPTGSQVLLQMALPVFKSAHDIAIDQDGQIVIGSTDRAFVTDESLTSLTPIDTAVDETRVTFNHYIPSSSPSTPDLLLVLQEPGASVYYLQERQISGTLVSSTVIPVPLASTDLQDSRGLTVDPLGNVNIYNGTFDPYLSTYSPASQTWSHQTFSGWSTVNNGTYGTVAAFNNFVFATDMVTFGSNEDQLSGLIRFDLSGGATVRFADTHEFSQLTLGLDGLLYGLTSYFTLDRNHVYVYNPQTLAAVRDFVLPDSIVPDTRSIAVDVNGNILAAAYEGKLVRFDPSGTQILAQTTLVDTTGFGTNIFDLALDRDGRVAVSDRFGMVFLTDESLGSVSSFMTNKWSAFVTFNHYIGTLAVPASFDSLLGGTISFGQPTLTLGGHISGGAQIPTGSVNITLAGVTLAAHVDPSTGNFAVAFDTSTLAASGSPYTVTYSYPGDANHGPVQDTSKTVIVQGIGTSAAVTSAVNPSNVNSATTFTATIVSAGTPGVPTGTVTFKDGSSVLGNVALDGTGHAVFTTYTLDTGNHLISANFVGTGPWLNSSGILNPQTVVLATGFDVKTFAGNAQHTGLYAPIAQDLNSIHWSTPIDVAPGAFAHYGAPLVSASNTVFVPVKISDTGFRIDAFNGNNGAFKYSLSTDYILPSFDWVPVYEPVLVTGAFGTRLYYAGAGGSIWYIDNPDNINHGAPVRVAFYGTYSTNFDSSVFINTPMTGDTNGNVFFGFRVQGTAPFPSGNTSSSGFARIPANIGSGGVPSFVLAGNLVQGQTDMTFDSHNSAPALSNDQSTLYVLIKNSTDGNGYLVGLNSTTLATKYSVRLKDPRNNNAADAVILDVSTASPMVAPDGDVYIGVFASTYMGARGWLLRFSGDLAAEKNPGGFGWDQTPSIVPASMVPSYTGSSSYLIFSKYNNYATGDSETGDGVNKLALLDPNGTQIDPHPAANGQVELREVFTIIGPTPDAELRSATYPNAVREWCINASAVNPATNSVFFDSEDGRIYRWNLATNSLSQTTALTQGVGEPYVPSVIGPDGTIYTLNGGTLFALGDVNLPLSSDNAVAVQVIASPPDHRTAVIGDSLTFTAHVANIGSSGAVPTGTVTFTDTVYFVVSQGVLDSTTTTLADNVPLDAFGYAGITLSTLSADQHFITATYSGDGTFSGGSMTLVQKVHANATITAVTATPNTVNFGQAVSITATVQGAPSDSGTPSGMVTFYDGSQIIAQQALDNGSTSFNISNLSGGSHVITAVYYSDFQFAASTGDNSGSPIIVQDGTTTAVTSSPNPSSFGQAVTFTATVSANDAGAGIPGGSVTFTEGATVLAANVAVDGIGHASFAISTLSVGSHTIAATFNGANGWLGSSGTSGSQLVQAGTSTSVSSSPNPSGFGQSVTFTATITATSPLAGIPTGSVTFQEGATILASGIAVDGSGQATFSTSALGGGSHTITANFIGTNGWQNSSESGTPQIVLDGTSTALTSSANPASFLQSVTFTATVTAADAGAGMPSGTVTFIEGATVLAANVALDATGHAIFSISTLAVGTHDIVATFTGAVGWGGSFGTVTQQIVEGTSTAVGSSLSVANFGQAISFTATVSSLDSPSDIPTGTVTFTEGATILAVVAVDNSGQASFSTSTLSVGSHNITAAFTGANGFTDSSGVSPAVLVQEGTAVTIFGAPNSSIFGQLVTFTATVTAVDAGAGVPVGAVTFMDGTTALATVLLDGFGQATYTTGALTAGSHTITVAFAGAAGWLDSSNSTTQEVNKASTATAVVSSDHPSVFGQFVTFTATVAAVAPGAGVPVGVVTFKDGAITIGAAILDGNGQATFTISSLLVGSHSITAVYGGGDNFIDSASGSITQTVIKATTTTRLTRSVSTSKVGQSVTLTARVVANAPSSGIPGGFVIFRDNNIVLAIVALDATGKATVTTSALSYGTRQITATYVTNAGYIGSRSAILIHKVTARGRR